MRQRSTRAESVGAEGDEPILPSGGAAPSTHLYEGAAEVDEGQDDERDSCERPDTVTAIGVAVEDIDDTDNMQGLLENGSGNDPRQESSNSPEAPSRDHPTDRLQARTSRQWQPSASSGFGFDVAAQPNIATASNANDYNHNYFKMQNDSLYAYSGAFETFNHAAGRSNSDS